MDIAEHIEFLFTLLQEDLIVFAPAKNAKEQVALLAQALENAQQVSDAQELIDAVMEREHILSTAIGSAVALPHARLDSVEKFSIAIGIQPDRPILWGEDAARVQLTFLVIGPSSKQTEYLYLLSALTTLIHSTEIKQELINATSSAEVISLLKEEYDQMYVKI